MRRATSEARRRIGIATHPSCVWNETSFRVREPQPVASSLSYLLSIQRRTFSSSPTSDTKEGTRIQEEDSSQFNTAPIRGMHDIFPEQSFIRRHILQKAEQVAETYGYGEIQTPIVERTQLYVRSLGGDTDVVSKEMYSFQDRSENQLSLRPENTAGVVRSFLSIPKSRQRESLPCKYFYYGPMFRYERPQKGRYRQFHQIGFEHFSLIGGDHLVSPSAFISSNSLHSDTDIICSAVRFLHELKLLNQTTLTINTLGDEESRNVYRGVLHSYFEEHRSQLSPLSQARLDRGSVLRILDSKEKIDNLLIQEAPSLRR
jgi:histidyl-tRNA synthetase